VLKVQADICRDDLECSEAKRKIEDQKKFYFYSMSEMKAAKEKSLRKKEQS
jgi:hypothetical protein